MNKDFVSTVRLLQLSCTLPTLLDIISPVLLARLSLWLTGREWGISVISEDQVDQVLMHDSIQ